jgi:hypothetical protein
MDVAHPSAHPSLASRSAGCAANGCQQHQNRQPPRLPTLTVENTSPFLRHDIEPGEEATELETRNVRITMTRDYVSNLEGSSLETPSGSSRLYFPGSAFVQDSESQPVALKTAVVGIRGKGEW